MNLYKLFVLFCLFESFFSLTIGASNKKNMMLYMKKNGHVLLNKYIPKTEKQTKYVKYLDDNNVKIIISHGPAGTGKTLFACQKSIIQLKKEEISKIIITRPLVTVEEELGFLPGDIIKKMDPWTKPIFDIFLEYFSKAELDLMLNNNKIEICPIAFMRGRTFKNAFIIADEMQNSSPNQMKMLTTRLGDNSRLVITGDLQQSDIKWKNGLNNGLNDFINKVNNYKVKNDCSNLISLVEFEKRDVERSDIVKQVIDIYDYNSDVVFNKIINKPVVKVEPVEPVEPIEPVVKVEPIEPVVKVEPIEIIKTNKKKVKKNNKDLDAALIPKHHYTHNYDIFFEKTDF
jgi:phosphate starvation-inducible PhoH-like protein